MTTFTLEKTHALLEKLPEYVMNDAPTRREWNERFEAIDKRLEDHDKRFDAIDKRLDAVDKRFDTIEEHLRAQDKQLDIIRAEQAVFAKTFELHNKRLGFLELHTFGYRVRDKEDKSRG